MVKRAKADIEHYPGRYFMFAVRDDGTGPNSLAHSPFPWARSSVRASASRQLPPSHRPSGADQRLPRRQPHAKVNPSGSEKGVTPDQRAVRATQPNSDVPVTSQRIETHEDSLAAPKKSSSQLSRKRVRIGPMKRRMGSSSWATKLTGGERLQIARELSGKDHDTRQQALFAHQSTRHEREQLRQRRKAEKQQQQQRAQTKMASRRCESYNVVDLTQTDNEDEVKQTNKEEKPEMVSDDEEDDDILRVIDKEKYPCPPSQEADKVPQAAFTTPENALQTASTALSSVPSAFEENENVILLSSDDEKPTRLKRRRGTNLYPLSVSDPSFAPPASESEADEPRLPRVKKSTAKRKRSPLRIEEDKLEADLRSIENTSREMHAAKDVDAPQEKKSIDLKISVVPAFPKEISKNVDGVIVVSDEESSVQIVKDTPMKSGMTRLFERRTIPPQSFYSNTTQTYGGTVGDIHIPALKYKPRVPDPLPRKVIPLEPSDDEDDDVIECEPVTKQSNGLTLGDYEMPDYFIKEEPFFEPDSKRARDIRFRPLNEEELAMVASLSHRVPKQRLLVRIQEANIGLKGEDFGCLRGSRWLNDEILNSFAALINSRNTRDVRSEAKREDDNIDVGRAYSIDVDAPQDDVDDIFLRKRPRTHVFNTFFFPRLTQKGYDYNGVRRWLKRAGLSVLSLDLILIPINLKNFHWVLTAIDLRSKHFLYLDSTYGKDTSNTISMLKKWLFDEVKDKHGAETAEKMGINFWRVHINPPYLPRQKDGGSCGVFTLYMADYLERGLRPNFMQRDIRNLRRRTILFLRDGYLPN